MAAGTVPDHPMGPITADELMRRGVSDEIEGRALDVVLRCGWPRPGDVLGMKPCIPVPMDQLQHALDCLNVTEVAPRVRLDEVRTFIEGQLRFQRYVAGVYVKTAREKALPELKGQG